MSAKLYCTKKSMKYGVIFKVVKALLALFCASCMKVDTTAMKLMVLLSEYFSKFSSLIVNIVMREAGSG